ncbi:transcription factor [Colletotrichum sojae]|uniref:DNA-binding protein RAP1 n=1 Tax=Colletotrichum sojae TaxID=2175907 RepID=A0A8H6MQJ3_9PEZI|nr:transcription factor [Colletotrichum sojae]
MAAAITHEGVQGARGTLFGGKSFFVQRCIPDRTGILHQITQNGGKIMPLEKNADYLISDHLSKNRTPACLSWQFVTDSISNGAVQEEDKYRLIQSPMTGHNARSSKSKRVPFTKEDDAVLARWVLSRQHSGGNKIYQELERTSWRSRFLDKLAVLPRKDLERLAASAPEVTSATSSSSAPKLKKPAGTGMEALANVRPSTIPRETTLLSRVDPVVKEEFTEEDDHTLLTKVLEHEHGGEHWMEEATRLRSRIAQDEPLLRLPFPSINSQPKAINAEPSKRVSIKYTGHIEPPMQRTEAIITKRAGLATGRAEAKMVPRPGKPPQRGVGEKDKGPHDLTRDDFYRHLETYRKLKDKTEPQIFGQPLDSWVLWEAVRKVYAGGATEVDWESLAKQMGFPPDASKVLRDHTDFIQEFMASFNDSDLSSDSDYDSPDEGDKAREDKFNEDRNSQHEAEEMNSWRGEESRIFLPRDTPEAKKKRKLPYVDVTRSSITLKSIGKRKRFRPDEEIPSTPEDKLGLASFGEFGTSPSLSLKHAPAALTVLEKSQKTDVSASRNPLHVEPETQDFGFDEDYVRAESHPSDDVDISPSQQLLGEVETSAPFPLAFDRASKRKTLPSQAVKTHPVPNPPPEDPEHRPPRGSQGGAEPLSQERANHAELDAFIENFKKVGYSHRDIITALMSTSLCAPLTTHVLRHLKKEKSLPRDWEGVWTERDDERLRRFDSTSRGSGHGEQRTKLHKHWDYLVQKHTLNRINQRREFLAYMDEVGDVSL